MRKKNNKEKTQWNKVFGPEIKKTLCMLYVI